MKKIRQKLILLPVLLSLILGCQIFTLGDEIEVSRKEATYTINPDTILESLEQGEKDVFSLQHATPEVDLSVSDTPVKWNQSDFLRIAQGFHQFVWNESLDDWLFGSMQFGLDCKDFESGPQYAYFGYYKVQSNGSQSLRIVHEIYILHQPNSIRSVETQYPPQLQDWKTLDLAKVKISLKDALAIAENHGGTKVRSQVENQCKIMLSLAPAAEYSGWQVLYSNNNTLLLVYIDPFSGEYQIMSTNVTTQPDR